MRLSDKIGNTPLLPITIDGITVWCKAEFLNPSGSVKDRMAINIINHAEKNKLLKKGDTLIEATSGNSGIAFSFLAAERGYKIKIIMPSNMSEERKKMLKFYGAELIEVDEGDFDSAILLRDKLANENGWFNCNQFHNPLNIEAHYNSTGVEIIEQLIDIDIKPDVFVSGTGTGGTLMGVGKKLRETWGDISLIAVEPYESPVMSGGEPGLHGIQGIGDGSKFLVDLNYIDGVSQIKTECAKKFTKKLILDYGLFVGISSGANVMATFQWLTDNNKKNGITILCDRGERYLSCI